MPVSKLCLFYFLVIFCLGCSDNSSRNEPPVFEYEFKNQSGHKLTIQLIDEYGNFPNPLILENEESFSWGNSKHRPGFFPFQAKELCILEFDDISESMQINYRIIEAFLLNMDINVLRFPMAYHWQSLCSQKRITNTLSNMQ